VAESVTLATLVLGYRRAYTRWMAGPRLSADADEAFMGIFESLNWAAVVDQRLSDADGRAWPSDYGEQDRLAAFRYARNAVHHDWAYALEMLPGVVLPTPLPFAFLEWVWRASLPSTRRAGVTQYRTKLAGKPVRFTLDALNSLLAKAVT
jgi:hypothetical protein